MLSDIDPRDLGDRLRICRERAGLTQAAAADSIGVARTTLVAIEQGVRRVRLAEIQGLSRCYGVRMNELLRKESVFVDVVPRFRKLNATSGGGIDQAVRLLAGLIRAELELEDLLGVRRSVATAPERPILPGDISQQAEHNAIELREYLGLGMGPITDIFGVLELGLNVRLYVRPLDSGVSGLFAYDKLAGPCVLINSRHPLQRRVQTAAHECGHLISTRDEPEVLYDSANLESRVERYAEEFGRVFLTPARAVMQKFKEVTAGSDRLLRRHVIILSHYFRISREAMVRRMEELQLARPGTWNWFMDNGGITNDQVRQVLGVTDDEGVQNNAALGSRLQLLAFESLRRGVLTESQLASLLDLDLIELRSIIDGIDSVDHEDLDNEYPRILH